MRAGPLRPWARVGVDLFQYGRQTYLVAFDAYSNFPEVEHLTHTTTDAVVNALSAIFARHGLPIEVCSDNGPEFSSSDFKAFALKHDFRHVTSSPHFPCSNGLAERGVQIVKRIMKKSEHAQEDYRLGLLNYRSSPLEDGRSPSELLMGRRIRSRLPDFLNRLQMQCTSISRAAGSEDHFNHFLQGRWFASGKRISGQRRLKSRTWWPQDPTRSSRKRAEHCGETDDSSFQHRRTLPLKGKTAKWRTTHAWLQQPDLHLGTSPLGRTRRLQPQDQQLGHRPQCQRLCLQL